MIRGSIPSAREPKNIIRAYDDLKYFRNRLFKFVEHLAQRLLKKKINLCTVVPYVVY